MFDLEFFCLKEKLGDMGFDLDGKVRHSFAYFRFLQNLHNLGDKGKWTPDT